MIKTFRPIRDHYPQVLDHGTSNFAKALSYDEGATETFTKLASPLKI